MSSEIPKGLVVIIITINLDQKDRIKSAPDHKVTRCYNLLSHT
jgi:hypothetical protein